MSRRKILLWTLGLLVAGFALIQAVPYGRNHDNPAVVQEPSWPSAEARALVAQNCFDCHSNETKWPWYSNIAPVSWIVQNHVDEGRATLNFSRWDQRQNSREIVEVLREGEMPPLYYNVFNRPSSSDRDQMISDFLQMLGR